jgi:carbon storage regulator
MLVLTRRSSQSIMIGDDIEISVLATAGDKVKIGVRAPRSIPVFRREVYLEKGQQRVTARAAAPAGGDVARTQPASDVEVRP